MKKTITCLSIFLFILSLGLSFAFEIPSYEGFVTDKANVLTKEQKLDLEKNLRNYEKKTTNEIALLLIPSTNGVPIERFALETARKWGVGKKEYNNGVLVVLAIKDHRSRIETGLGVEDLLPDSTAHMILHDAVPYLRQGDFYQASKFIIDSIEKNLGFVPFTEAKKLYKKKEKLKKEKEEEALVVILGSFIILASIVGGMILFVVIKEKIREKQELKEEVDYRLNHIKSLFFEIETLKKELESLIKDKQFLNTIFKDIPKIEKEFKKFVPRDPKEDSKRLYNIISQLETIKYNLERELDLIKRITRAPKKYKDAKEAFVETLKAAEEIANRIPDTVKKKEEVIKAIESAKNTNLDQMQAKIDLTSKYLNENRIVEASNEYAKFRKLFSRSEEALRRASSLEKELIEAEKKTKRALEKLKRRIGRTHDKKLIKKYEDLVYKSQMDALDWITLYMLANALLSESSSYSSSHSSYSSGWNSDSDSFGSSSSGGSFDSFGGFGGGDFGGGGASGDW